MAIFLIADLTLGIQYRCRNSARMYSTPEWFRLWCKCDKIKGTMFMLLRKNSRMFALIWNWRMFQSTSDAQEALLAGVRVQGSKVTAAMYLLSCG